MKFLGIAWNKSLSYFSYSISMAALASRHPIDGKYSENCVSGISHQFRCVKNFEIFQQKKIEIQVISK